MPTTGGDSGEPWIGTGYVRLKNTTGSVVKLGGYALWNKVVRDGKYDSPRHIFGKDQTLPAGGTLLVPTAFLDPASDRIEFANLNKALVDCQAWGGQTCRSATPTALPSSPVGITALTTPSTVTVNWGAPISQGGTPVTGYLATAFDAATGGSAIGSCAAGGDQRTCTFPGTVGTTYFVEVQARNAIGTSAPSWRVQAVPRTIPAAPSGVTTAATTTTVAVSWTPGAANGAAITGYTASAYQAGTGGSATSSCTAAAETNTCTLTGLAAGTTYYVDVTATNKVGTSAASSPRTPVTTTALTPPVSAPASAPVTAPINPPATAPASAAQGPVTTYTKKKVTVRWTRVPGVTGYSAKVYTAPTGGKLVASCTGGPTTSRCTTRKTAKTYKKLWVALTMTSPAGTSTVDPRIETGLAKKASPPTSVGASSAARKVTVSWKPPTSNGYRPLTSYSARLYTKAKGGSVKATCSTPASRSSCATKKLTKGKTYYATVRVKNSKGWSKYAAPRIKITVA